MSKKYEIIIIGAGFAGICMAIRLKKAGFTDFIILERNSNLGGTWYDNIYPGAACDVQSHLYSFSFEPNPNWSKMFSSQDEILNYTEHCSKKYQLETHFHYNKNIQSLIWNEAFKHWSLNTEDGDRYESQLVVSCSGGLSQPSFPNIKGLENFTGKIFHTARWDKKFDISNKTIGIIGTGASAIQIVPAIAQNVKKLFVYQRSPAWIIPKADRKMSSFEKTLFRRIPFIGKLFRWYLYWLHEASALGFIRYPAMMRIARGMALRNLKKNVIDDVLKQKLTPNYTIGCKRILLSNDYYPALNSENVELITDEILEINSKGITLKNGEQQVLDAIVLATGFKAAEAASSFEIRGNAGVLLNDVWQNGAEAYLGSTVSGFPNLFFIVGPNTGLGHSSMLLMIEAQSKYILDSIETMKNKNLKVVEVKPQIQKKYNEKLQEKLQKTVWQTGGCKSWYQNEEGKNVTLWPSFTFRFKKMTKQFDLENYYQTANT